MLGRRGVEDLRGLSRRGDVDEIRWERAMGQMSSGHIVELCTYVRVYASLCDGCLGMILWMAKESGCASASPVGICEVVQVCFHVGLSL